MDLFVWGVIVTREIVREASLNLSSHVSDSTADQAYVKRGIDILGFIFGEVDLDICGKLQSVHWHVDLFD